nr:Ig-like domain-containing protein [Leptospira chreensis]
MVQPIVNPEIDENDPVSTLGIAAVLAGPRTVQITGQVVDQYGVAVSGGTLTIVSRTNQLDGLSDSNTLNPAGRFYLTLSTGETTIRVDQAGSELFRFTITIPFPGSVIVNNISASGPDLVNLEFYGPGSTPEYFDLVTSDPTPNSADNSLPTYFEFTFSEPLDTSVSDQAAWIAANVISSPSITFNTTINFATNQFTLTYSSGISVGNTYTIILGTGIKSQTGKSLSPRIIKFTCLSPCMPS